MCRTFLQERHRLHGASKEEPNGANWIGFYFIDPTNREMYSLQQQKWNLHYRIKERQRGSQQPATINMIDNVLTTATCPLVHWPPDSPLSNKRRSLSPVTLLTNRNGWRLNHPSPTHPSTRDIRFKMYPGFKTLNPEPKDTSQSRYTSL